MVSQCILCSAFISHDFIEPPFATIISGILCSCVFTSPQKSLFFQASDRFSSSIVFCCGQRPLLWGSVCFRAQGKSVLFETGSSWLAFPQKTGRRSTSLEFPCPSFFFQLPMGSLFSQPNFKSFLCTASCYLL